MKKSKGASGDYTDCRQTMAANGGVIALLLLLILE